MRFVSGADAGFRVRGGASGVSTISAGGGGGGGGGGGLRSGPIQKVGGGGRFRSDIRKVWGGGFRSDIRKVGGGGGASGPIYEKWGGGGGGFRSDIRKVGGGGPFRFRSDTFGHTENILHVPTYVLPRYTSHARANERKIHAGKG